MPIIMTSGLYTPPSLSSLSWSEISEISRSGKAKEWFNIGDEKIIYINNEPHVVHIIGFDHDDITETEKTKYGRDTAGITFQLKYTLPNIYTVTVNDEYIGSEITVRWGESNIKQYLDNLIESFTIDLQNNICMVDKICYATRRFHNSNSGFMMDQGIREIESNKIFLLSADEVFGDIDEYRPEGQQYEYFLTKNIYTKNISTESSYINWWLRSVTYSTSSGSTQLYPKLYVIDENGDKKIISSLASGNKDNAKAYISFAFCI